MPAKFRPAGSVAIISTEHTKQANYGDSLGSGSQPDLNSLKAKALASIPKKREGSSSTPAREVLKAPMQGAGAHESTGQDDFEEQGSSNLAIQQRKDSRSDVDDLLAEEKAAVEARHSNRTNRHAGDEQDKQRSSVDGLKKSLEHYSDHAPDQAGKLQSSRANTELRDSRRTLNGRRTSDGPSEAGEIAEGQVSPVRKRESRETGEEHATPGRRSSFEDQGKRDLPTSSEGRMIARRDTFEVSGPASKHGSRPDPREHGKEFNNRPGRKESESTYTRYQSEDYGRLKEWRPSNETDSRRSSGDVPVSSRDDYTRRHSGDSDRGSRSARAYSASRRVIEIDDDDDHRPVSRVTQEQKRSVVRRYIEEPPRPSVIRLSDPYWADLEHWLEFTGYHDRSYREQALSKHKKLMVLDSEREALLRETQAIQEERQYATRGLSVQPRDEMALAISRVATVPRTVRSASVFEMPPPPLPTREERGVVSRLERADSGAATLRARSKPAYTPTADHREEGSARLRYIESSASQTESATLKRRYRSDDEDVESRPAEKLVRVDSRGRAAARAEADILPHSPRRNSGSEREDRRGRNLDSSGERRLLDDIVRIQRQDEGQRRPKDLVIRSREASAPVIIRQSHRGFSPPPRTASGPGEDKSHGKEEDRAKVDQNHSPSRSQGGSARDRSPPRKPQADQEVRSNGNQGPSWRDAQKDLPERSPEEGRAPYYSRGGYGNHSYPYAGRGRGRGRGGYHNGRLDLRVYNHNRMFMQQHPGSQELDLHQGGKYIRHVLVLAC